MTVTTGWDHRISSYGGSLNNNVRGVSVGDTNGDGYDDLALGGGSSAADVAQVIVQRGPLPFAISAVSADVVVQNINPTFGYSAVTQAEEPRGIVVEDVALLIFS